MEAHHLAHHNDLWWQANGKVSALHEIQLE